VAHVIQSGPDSGLDFRVEVAKTFKLFALGVHRGADATAQGLYQEKMGLVNQLMPRGSSVHM
jgi:hypothetical protein